MLGYVGFLLSLCIIYVFICTDLLIYLLSIYLFYICVHIFNIYYGSVVSNAFTYLWVMSFEYRIRSQLFLQPNPEVYIKT
jgi:uncharacterized membrane protein